MGPAGEEQGDNRGFQPGAAQAEVFRLTIFPSVDRGFDHDCASGQQHGIYRSKIIDLSVEDEENREASQVAPTEHAVGFQPRREQEGKQSGEPDGHGDGLNQERLL